MKLLDDADAHCCVQRDNAWSGYRTHFTETCHEERPGLMVHVATTISTVQDIELTDTIHDELAERQLPPSEQVVDSGYISPARIERAQRVHGITLLGPVVADHSSQATGSTSAPSKSKTAVRSAPASRPPFRGTSGPTG